MCKESTVMVAITIINSRRPGRAGGGEEMGGIRGVKHYMQRAALQGSPTTLTEITGVYQQHAKGKDPGKHPFKKYLKNCRSVTRS
jgi:hypothetical protein